GEPGLLVEEQVVGGDVGERRLRGGGAVDAAGGGAEGECRQEQQAAGAEQRDADQSRSSSASSAGLEVTSACSSFEATTLIGMRSSPSRMSRPCPVGQESR